MVGIVRWELSFEPIVWWELFENPIPYTKQQFEEMSLNGGNGNRSVAKSFDDLFLTLTDFKCQAIIKTLGVWNTGQLQTK